MGHYDEQYEADYARQRAEEIARERAKQDQYRFRVHNALIDLKSSLSELGNSRQLILDHYEILQLLLEKELSDD